MLRQIRIQRHDPPSPQFIEHFFDLAEVLLPQGDRGIFEQGIQVLLITVIWHDASSQKRISTAVLNYTCQIVVYAPCVETIGSAFTKPFSLNFST